MACWKPVQILLRTDVAQQVGYAYWKMTCRFAAPGAVPLLLSSLAMNVWSFAHHVMTLPLQGAVDEAVALKSNHKMAEAHRSGGKGCGAPFQVTDP